MFSGVCKGLVTMAHGHPFILLTILSYCPTPSILLLPPYHTPLAAICLRYMTRYTNVLNRVFIYWSKLNHCPLTKAQPQDPDTASLPNSCLSPYSPHWVIPPIQLAISFTRETSRQVSLSEFASSSTSLLAHICALFSYLPSFPPFRCRLGGFSSSTLFLRPVFLYSLRRLARAAHVVQLQIIGFVLRTLRALSWRSWLALNLLPSCANTQPLTHKESDSKIKIKNHHRVSCQSPRASWECPPNM